jgi:hypothetical protein
MTSRKDTEDLLRLGSENPCVLKMLLEQTNTELLEAYLCLDAISEVERTTLNERIRFLEDYLKELIEVTMELEPIKITESVQYSVYEDIGSPSNGWDLAKAELDPEEIKYLAGKMFAYEQVTDELLTTN